MVHWALEALGAVHCVCVQALALAEAARVEQQVLGLEVAVDDALVVQVLEGEHDLCRARPVQRSHVSGAQVVHC